MTDPREPRLPHDRTPLEPWALDLLDRESESDPSAREELARVVALLRSLPDPEIPPRLVEGALARIAEEQRRPRQIRRAVLGWARRLVPPPPVALAIAAGVAGWIAFAPDPIALMALLGGTEPVDRVASISDRTASSEVLSRPGPARRRAPAVVRPQFVSLFAQAPTAEPHLRFDRSPVEEAFDQRLDRQLNQLMIDPTAFAERLERVAQRDQFIARLADRAARRGDAPEIALRVRQSSHPLAHQMVNRLLRANLVASVSSR